MDKNTQVIISVVAILIVVGGCALVLTAAANNSDAQWEDMTERAIENKGYSNIHLASCSHMVNGESAMALGSFTSNGNYHSYTVDFVKENGSWKVYKVTVV